MMKKTIKMGSMWALNAFVAAAAAHFADCPEKAAPWLAAAEYVRPAVEANERLATLKELRKLPTWALQAVAKAATERPFQTRRYKAIASGLVTEYERRRAKAAGPAQDRRAR